MLVPFNQLPDTARVWVYQSSRAFNEDEVKLIRKDSESFIESWTAHQANLKAGVEVFHNRFVVIAVDENYNDASGCSIDKKVNFMKQLGSQLQTDFFNRMEIAFIDHGVIKTESMHNLVKIMKNGKLDNDTIIFNNLVSTKAELNSSWKIPASTSWLHQMVK